MLPRGTVSFLFMEVEGSPALLEDTRQPIEAHNGSILEQEPGRWCAAFASARDAVVAALDAQLALQRQGMLQVRMALNTGDVELRDGRYVGPALSRCLRLMTTAHGGQTLLSGVTGRLVRDALPPGASLWNLGMHRLKDLAEPEQVYQVMHPELQADFPALRSLDIAPHNLPVQLTSFVDREREMVEIEALLGISRLVTLTGTGGAGKTRLALQLAAQVVDRFSDGAWWVELAPVTDPALVPHAVATVLGVREEADRPLLSTLREQLRSRHLLLLLDNCEHLVASCAALADSLLRVCPDVRILATSREALGVSGETIWRVPSLPVPERQSVSAVEQLSGYGAARLFIDRAVAARHEFSVTNANAPALVQICWRLDGIPLAIELAAARVKVLSLEQIAARLDDLFRLLVGGGHLTVPRQQTLRAAIDWSYDLLSERERRLFNGLSVFSGGWTLEAAEGICSGDGVDAAEVLDLLEQLVDKSLVTTHESGGSIRYGLLETLREYGTERLRASAQMHQARDRHAAWFLGLAERVEPLLLGAEQGTWLQVVEQEHDNMRTALKWLMESGDVETALQCSGALWRFWEARAHFTEGRRWLAETLAAGAGVRPAVRAKALTGAGLLTSRQGDFVEAVQLLQASLALYAELGDQRGMAYALTYLAVQAQEQGQTETAAELHERSISLYESLGEDRHGLARSLNNLGYHLLLQGDVQEAAPYLERSLAIGRELGDARLIAVVLYNLAWVAKAERQPGRAQALYEECLVLFQQARDTRWIAFALQQLGGVAQGQGNYERAFALTAESLGLFRDVGEKAGAALCLERMATLAIVMGDAERAAVLLGAAEVLRERQHYPLHRSEIGEHQRRIAEGAAQVNEQVWASAWLKGRTASLEEAMELALTPPIQPPESEVAPKGVVLTRREQQVAGFIAQGLTNRQMAEALIVSERTIDAHVDHIRDKLGVRSRAAIAGWAVANSVGQNSAS